LVDIPIWVVVVVVVLSSLIKEGPPAIAASAVAAAEEEGKEEAATEENFREYKNRPQYPPHPSLHQEPSPISSQQQKVFTTQVSFFTHNNTLKSFTLGTHQQKKKKKISDLVGSRRHGAGVWFIPGGPIHCCCQGKIWKIQYCA
jgi:hypothetical protein